MALRIFKYISGCQVYSTDCFIDKYNFIQKLYKLCINESSATLVERQEESETQSPTRTPCLLRTQSENYEQEDWEQDGAMEREQISKRSMLRTKVSEFAGHTEVQN